MMGLKQLPPAIRRKQRYIIFQIHSEKEFEIGKVVNAVWDGLYRFLGEKGVSEADPWIMKSLFDRKKQVGGIKTGRDHVSDIRTALTLIESIDSEKVCINSIGVSGTMESAREKFISQEDQ